MKHTFILVFILIIAVSLPARCKEDKEIAKAARDIKLAGEQYWWDEISVSKTWLDKNPQQREILRQSLKLGLGNKIKSYVQGSISVTETETDGYSSSRSQRSVMVSSNLHLKNVGYLQFQKENKQITLFAYLKRSDFWAQEDEVITRINNIVAEARNLESKQQSDYLYPYYRAYLMSYNITRSFQGNNGEEDMQQWLETKLHSIMNDIRIQSTIAAGSSTRDKPIELMLDCPATHSGLLIELPSLGFNQLAVIDGKCKLFYPGQPSQKIEEQQINIIINPALVASDPEIAELAKLRPIMVQKTIKLDFSFLFNIDFCYQIDNLTASFKPRYGDISIKSVEWDLGDGTQICSLDAFEHKYPRSGTYQVSMLVNGEYPVVKKLSVNPYQIKGEQPEQSPEHKVTSIIELPFPEPVIEVSPNLKTDSLKTEQTEVSDSEGSELLQFSKLKELISYLECQKAERKLTWGKLTRSSLLDRAWIVISEQDGTIIAILQPQSGSFIDLLSKKQINDVFATYHGKAAIYISYF